MSWPYRISCLLARFCSLRRIFMPGSNGKRVLMYHAIGSRIADDSMGFYTLSEPVFRQQMQTVAALVGGRSFSLDRIDRDNAPFGVGISFDDGYRDNLLVAAPILHELKIPFTVFVITGAVQRGDSLFVSASEIKRLVNDYGAVIGSHSVTHARLAQCNDRQLGEELTSSRHYLEDLLGREVDTLSYPHGSVDQRVCDAAAEAGYRLGFTSYFGANHAGDNPFALARIPIMSRDSDLVFRQKIQGDWDWYAWLQKLR